MKKLQTFALAAALLGAAAPATHAATLYQVLSVDLVLTYQGMSTTNSKGEIKDVKESVSLSTAKFLELLATNLNVTTLSHGASLVKATTLAPGVNFTNVITNSTTNIPGYTFLTSNFPNANFFENNTNTIPTEVVYITNGGTNLFVTSNLDAAPPSGYVLDYYTNFVTNIVQAKGDAVIVGTSVQYFLNPGPGFEPANFIPLNTTNDNAGATASATDDATRFLNNTILTDDNNVFGDTFGSSAGASRVTNFFLAQNITNVGLFVGTVKTNFEIAGTLYHDALHLTVGPPREPIGSPAPVNLNIEGGADATAMTQRIGSGSTAMPFSSWNASFDVSGDGTLGGTVTNTLSVTYVYLSSGQSYLNENAGFYEPPNYIRTSPTNPPPTFTNGFLTNSLVYTNVATNVYTSYSVVHPTNGVVYVSGTVKQMFYKLVQ